MLFVVLSSNHTYPAPPSSHRQDRTRVSRIFLSFKFVYGEGKGGLQQVALFYEGTQKLKTNANTASLSQRLLSRILD